MGDIEKSKYMEQFAPQEKKLMVDYDTTVQYRGRHREVSYLLAEHSFKKPDGMMFSSYTSIWCTYVFLTEEMHEKYKGRINEAPWNGGQTYYRKIKEEHVDMSPGTMKDKWERPFYKIGDDFNHSWDNDRYEMYSKEYMERHIKKVIDYLIDGSEEV